MTCPYCKGKGWAHDTYGAYPCCDPIKEEVNEEDQE